MTEILTATSEDELKKVVDEFCMGKIVKHISFSFSSTEVPRRGMAGMQLSNGDYAMYHSAYTINHYKALIMYEDAVAKDSGIDEWDYTIYTKDKLVGQKFTYQSKYGKPCFVGEIKEVTKPNDSRLYQGPFYIKSTKGVTYSSHEITIHP